MSSSRWGTVASGLLIAAALATPSAAQQPEVVELRFEGASSFTREELASAITVAETRCPNFVYQLLCWTGLGREEAYLPTGSLEADALRLRVYYYERGFREAEVAADTARVAEDGVRVTFDIDEGRPVRVAEVQVAEAPAGLSARGLPLRAGGLFDVVAYEATRDTLLNRLRNNGYAHGQVLVGYSISREDPYAATVQYEVIPGPQARFGAIEVQGNREASEELVRRMLTFETGEVYDRSALLESQRNLYRLEIFRHAEVQAGLAAESASVIPITVQVAEGDMRRVRLGGGINNAECGNIEGRWSSRNFGGNGRRVEVRGRVGNLLMGPLCEQVGLLSGEYAAYDSLTGLVSIDLTQPWFFGPRNSISLGLFGERRSVPEVFFRSAVGGYVSVARSLGRGATLALGYRPELTLLQTEGDLFFCVNFVACAYEDLALLREPHWLSPLTLSFVIDRTDAVFTPSSGFVVRSDLEHGGGYTGSDFSYTRLLAEASTYGGEQGGVILAARLRSGAAWPHEEAGTGLRLNPQKRFFAGGPNSVRGFDQYQLGPTILGIDAVPHLIAIDSGGTARVEGAGCTPAQVNDGTCSAGMLPNGRFNPRPAGGEVLLEGNLELRFPLPIPGGKVRGAAFVDAGQVWATSRDVDLGEVVATPGLGIRYLSPIGPIRIDAAFNTRGSVSLPVLTTRVEECLAAGRGCQAVDGVERWTLRNTDNVIRLAREVRYGDDSLDSVDDVLRRFRLHFSIGQAF